MPRIYTKTGDDGTTGLLYGGRVGKDSAVADACGTVDEAQAALGQAGLQVTNVFGPPNRRVFTTDPAAGASVRRGAGVNLYTK